MVGHVSGDRGKLITVQVATTVSARNVSIQDASSGSSSVDALFDAYAGLFLQLKGPRTFSPAGFSEAAQRLTALAAKVPSAKERRREFRSRCA